MTTFEPGIVATDEVGYAIDGVLGRIMLNRPKAINALTQPMIVSMSRQLDEWRDDDRVEIVSIQGAGERGLCAGGDVRLLRDAILGGDGDPASFWADEYRLNAAIASYPKPIVAVMDGVTMGGGVGISAHATHRLATERSRIAMPETAIGFFPDVGAMHLLSRAPGEWGTHLALTGLPVDGSVAVHCGLSDVVLESSEIDSVLDRIASGVDPVSAWTPTPIDAPGAEYAWVDECYVGDDPVAIMESLLNHDSSAARGAGAVLQTRSPLSVAVTLVALRRAASMSLSDVLAQDLRLGRAFSDEPDFVEGVRAVLVDRDNDPRWKYTSLADVDRAVVDAMFS